MVERLSAAKLCDVASVTAQAHAIKINFLINMSNLSPTLECVRPERARQGAFLSSGTLATCFRMPRRQDWLNRGHLKKWVAKGGFPPAATLISQIHDRWVDYNPSERTRKEYVGCTS